MNLQTKNVNFDDIFFVRMKLEKSIQLPKSPLKNPTVNQQPLSSQGYLPRSFSPLKCLKQQNRYPSKSEIDRWLFKKQIKTRQLINKQNQRKLMELSNLNQDKIVLKKRVDQMQNKNLNIRNSKKTGHQIQKPGISGHSGLIQNFSQLKLKFENSSNTLKEMNISKKVVNSVDLSPQKQNTSIKKIEYYPVLLKSKSNLQKQVNQNLSQTSLSTEKSHNNKGISLTNSYKDLKLFDRTKTYSNRKSNQESLILTSEESHITNIQSQERKSLSRSVNFSTLKSEKTFDNSQIYQDNIRGNRMIKNYTYRQKSPDEKIELKNKYSRLEKRLDGILRSVRTQK